MINLKSTTILLLGIAITANAAAKAPQQRIQAIESVLPVLKQSRVVGKPSPTQMLHLAIGLQPRFPTELQAFCDAVSNPRSPNYRQFMTPAQVGEAFGASSQDVANVQAFLKSQGMKISLLSPNRMGILVDATVAQAEAAFGTQLKNFVGPDYDGKTSVAFMANATPITLPENISNVVINVDDLQTYTRPLPRTTLLNPITTSALYGVAPAHTAGQNGQGRTIAFNNFVGLRTSNVPLYVAQYGLAVPATGVGTNIETVVIGASAAAGTENAEGDLDLQMELGMAPLSHIIIYDSTGSLTGVLTKEAAENRAEVISESYGFRLTSSQSTSAHNQHLALTAQGVTFMAASGDDGTAGLNGSSTYPYPDYEPEVLSVGGTIANVDGNGGRISEVGWSGSGGGWSTNTASFNKLPSWQVGNGVPTNLNFRLVPDIGMHAAGNGTGAYLFYLSGALSSGYVGTSFACPVAAGCFGILEQRLAANGLGPRLGRVQDLIYAENGRSDVWRDITSGSNGTLPNNASSSCTPGWDFVTGWGAPNFDAWYTVLSTRTISGTVSLADSAVPVTGTPITVQLYAAGTTTLVDTKNTTLDASGNFTVSSQAPGSSYDIYIKASHWLRKKLGSQSFGFTALSGVNVTLVNGDVNGDNVISLSDFTALRSAFNSTPADANWNANADLNGNGSVSLTDFSILRTNFGTNGD